MILDRDVQLLVNDLWAAGAEAISIGGVRLQPSSAIRQAGGSILVDNRPVFWPITIEAIGDPSGLQVKSVGSPGLRPVLLVRAAVRHRVRRRRRRRR